MNLERNYKGTGEKILLEEDLGKDELKVVLDIGLGFIKEEIENNNPGTAANLKNRSEEEREYFPYLTLVRLARRYKELKGDIVRAVENNDSGNIIRLSENKSVQLFGKLKDFYFEKLNIPDKEKDNIKFDDKLIETICCRQDLFDEEKYISKIKSTDMKMLANWAADIVPSDSTSSDYRGIEHILD